MPGIRERYLQTFFRENSNHSISPFAILRINVISKTNRLDFKDFKPTKLAFSLILR